MGSIIIGMAELEIVKSPERITTLGLGSCIGVVLYDRITRIGGMVHIVLPDSKNQTGINRAKFADTGINELLHRMLCAGANRNSITAKLAGGANMFGSLQKNDLLNVGVRNAECSKLSLGKLRIPIVAEDLGGSHGRTIELNCEDGSLKIKTLGKCETII